MTVVAPNPIAETIMRSLRKSPATCDELVDEFGGAVSADVIREVLRDLAGDFKVVPPVVEDAHGRPVTDADGYLVEDPDGYWEVA